MSIHCFRKLTSFLIKRPQHPELTVAEEIIAVENVDILRANGFEIDIDLDQEPTRRIKVVSQPVSKSTSFDSKGIICKKMCQFSFVSYRPLLLRL